MLTINQSLIASSIPWLSHFLKLKSKVSGSICDFQEITRLFCNTRNILACNTSYALYLQQPCPKHFSSSSAHLVRCAAARRIQSAMIKISHQCSTDSHQNLFDPATIRLSRMISPNPS